jgi:hypothetical protein
MMCTTTFSAHLPYVTLHVLLMNCIAKFSWTKRRLPKAGSCHSAFARSCPQMISSVSFFCPLICSHKPQMGVKSLRAGQVTVRLEQLEYSRVEHSHPSLVGGVSGVPSATMFSRIR